MIISARQPISSFYVVGGTLRRDARCYVERKADQQLYFALRQQEMCYVLTPRQMGKSSLMVRTGGKLRDDGVAVAVLDLTALGQNLSPNQWYNGLLDKVAQQLRLEDEVEDTWLRLAHVGPFQRWVRVLQEVVLPRFPVGVTVFVDEIDAIRSLPFSTDEFFAGIRELYNRRTQEPDLRRLTFCLMGVATPTDLIRDMRTTPFNVGRRIELTDFSEEEAAPLAEGLGREDAMSRELLRRVLYWTGGHPYLTQRLCQAIAENYHVHGRKDIDLICGELFLSRRARQRDDNLLFVRQRILGSELEKAALLTIYAKIRAKEHVRDDETDPLIAVLRLSGITKVKAGYLEVRNRVYFEAFDDAWIVSNLPGAELRRQRAAYIKGLQRAAAVFLPLMAMVVGFGWWYLYQRTAALDVSLKLPQPRVPVFWQSAYMRTPLDSLQLGALLVKTGDKNVAVFINEQQYGRTTNAGELKIRGLSAGLYRVRVEKQGFQTVTQDARIVQNSETQIAFKMQVQVVIGQIAIRNSPPGTTVRLDGKYVGLTADNNSFLMTASRGEHTIELTKEGFLPKQVTGLLSLGTLLTVDGELLPDRELQEWSRLENSQDLGELQSFLQRYPKARFAERAKSRIEQLQWYSIRDLDDLQAVDAFLQRYPTGPFAQAAKDKETRLLREQSDWYTAHNSKDVEIVKGFLAKYPKSQYANQARNDLVLLNDQQAIVEVMRFYEQAYGRKDLDALSRIWPTMPPQVRGATLAKFRDAQSVSLRMEFPDPKVDGNTAAVRGRQLFTWMRKDNSVSNAEYPFGFEMRKKDGVWIISKVTR